LDLGLPASQTFLLRPLAFGVRSGQTNPLWTKITPGIAGLAAGSHARRPVLNEIREFRKTMPRFRTESRRNWYFARTDSLVVQWHSDSEGHAHAHAPCPQQHGQQDLQAPDGRWPACEVLWLGSRVDVDVDVDLGDGLVVKAISAYVLQEPGSGQRCARSPSPPSGRRRRRRPTPPRPRGQLPAGRPAPALSPLSGLNGPFRRNQSLDLHRIPPASFSS
jgi:hypothetical protein